MKKKAIPILLIRLGTTPEVSRFYFKFFKASHSVTRRLGIASFLLSSSCSRHIKQENKMLQSLELICVLFVMKLSNGLDGSNFRRIISCRPDTLLSCQNICWLLLCPPPPSSSLFFFVTSRGLSSGGTKECGALCRQAEIILTFKHVSLLTLWIDESFIRPLMGQKVLLKLLC